MFCCSVSSLRRNLFDGSELVCGCGIKSHYEPRMGAPLARISARASLARSCCAGEVVKTGRAKVKSEIDIMNIVSSEGIRNAWTRVKEMSAVSHPHLHLY